MLFTERFSSATISDLSLALAFFGLFACILTDHNFSTLFDLSDRNYCISDGTIIAEGTKNDLLKNAEAIKRYFGTGFGFN